MKQNIYTDLCAIRTNNPLVHNITNFVVMQLTANALLALGASPIMAHAIEEMPEMAKLCQALVLNIGTLEAEWVTSMKQAAITAKENGIPIVLDPVGVGATTFRTKTALELIATATPTVVRGNAAEIMAVAGVTIESQGVDSKYQTDSAKEAATKLAAKSGSIVVVSGEVDLVTDGNKVVSLANGSPLMSKVTGMGCTASAVTAAFCAVNPDPFAAAAHATAVMGITGEVAAAEANGPGSFLAKFIDTIYNLSDTIITEKLKIVAK